MRDIALKTQQLVFITKEAIPGTLALPSPADCVPVVGAIKATQVPGYTDSPEMQESRGVRDRFQDGFSAGDLSLEIVPRLIAPGTPPVAAPLFESLMGIQIVTAGVNVSYTQAPTRPSFSVAYRKGHAVHWVSGARVSELKLSLSDKKGAAQLQFTGKFLKKITAGDDTTAGIAAAIQAVVSVVEAKRFMVGGRVHNPVCAANAGGADDNGGLGYAVIAVDSVLNQITLGSNLAFAWATGERIEGYLPAGQTVGTPLEKRHSVVTFGGTEGAVTNFEVTLADGVQPIEDEITSNPYSGPHRQDKLLTCLR